MTSDLIVHRVETDGLALHDPELERRTRENARARLADGTRAAYENDWKRFAAFCAAMQLPTLPASEQAICAHLNDLARSGEFKIGTLRRVYTSIRATHTHAGRRLPRFDLVQNTLANLAKELGGKTRQAAPFTLEDLRRFVELARRGVAGVRDRALVLVGFAAALRRSELVALNVDDLEFSSEGLRLWIERSKMDQAGAGVALGVNFGEGPLCPVEALRAWLDSGRIEAGAVFRPVDRLGRVSSRRLSDKHVDRLAKGVASLLGKNPERYSGHSFRAGLATTAAADGRSLDEIMRTTRHKSERVARGYIREGELFTRAANRGLMK